MPAELEILRVPWDVPFAGQVASPDLAAAIFTGQMRAEDDPAWAVSGAETPAEYAYWTERACGVACVKMCVEALGGPQRPLVAWARAGVSAGGYLSELRPDGSRNERGWLHSALAGLIAGAGYSAAPRAAELAEFPGLLRANTLLIASVSYQIGANLPVTKRGGHLVVVSGAHLRASQLEALIVYNPSGRTQTLREAAVVPAERFAAGYSGRIITVSPA